MTIYITDFKATRRPRTDPGFVSDGDILATTSPSVDSGFLSLDLVVETMGDEYTTRAPRYVVYGEGEDRVVFSDFAFRIDGPVNSG